MRYFILTLIILTTSIFANDRSNKEVYKIATHLIKEHNISREIIDENISKYRTLYNLGINQYSNYYSEKNEQKNNYKIVKLKPKGWIIVSTTDIANPILGYSFDSNASKELPIEVREWLNAINKDIEISKTTAVTKKLTTYGKTSRYQRKGPLLNSINLGQKYPYNKYTPTINGKHAPVGCVATAFTQIMNYYKFPRSSRGSHSYILNGKKIYANFNTSYDYSTNSLAKLSYNLGVAFDMNYREEISGTIPTRTRLNRVKNSFGYYVPSIRKKLSYSNDNWYKLIKNSIDNNRPIYYQGLYTQKYGGHAFVLDGYSYENNVKMFHFNWGWSGYYNGWFTLEPVRGYSLVKFPYSQKAIFNIKPNKSFTGSKHSKTTDKKSKNRKFIKAEIIYPKNNLTIKKDSIKVKIRKNNASKIRLKLYSYSRKKYIYNSILHNMTKTVKIDKRDSKILIILYSYDSKNRVKNKSSITIFVKENSKKVKKRPLFKKAIILSDSYVKGNILKVRYKKYSARKIKLIVYSNTQNRYIYNKFIRNNPKYIKIPKGEQKLVVGIYSYDNKGKYRGGSFIYPKSTNTKVAIRSAEINYPKNYQKIKNRNFYIQLNLGNSKRVKLQIYSYRLKGYIYSKYIYSKKIKILSPRSKDTLYVIVKTYNSKGSLVSNSHRYIFIDTNKEKGNFKIAKINYVNVYPYKTGHLVYIRFNKNQAPKVKVGIYSYRYKKYILFKENNKGSLSYYIHSKYKDIAVQLVTQNKQGKYINQDFKRLKLD